MFDQFVWPFKPRWTQPVRSGRKANEAHRILVWAALGFARIVAWAVRIFAGDHVVVGLVTVPWA
jgi:hypothetical protein